MAEGTEGTIREAGPGIDEDPTIEPLGDIEAQLQAMASGQDDIRDAAVLRRGVWFSRQNFIEHYRVALAYPREQLLTNFDGLGGVMLARSPADAEDMLQQKRSGVPIRTIIGRAIGAGDGKPLNNIPVRIVQLRTPSGAVARESAVPAADAQSVAQSWGPRAVILTIDETLGRRYALHYHNRLQ